MLGPAGFPQELFEGVGEAGTRGIRSEFPTLAEIRDRCIADSERRYLEDLLTRFGGRINISAEASGVGPRQFHKLMKKYRLRKESFKGSK